MLKDKTLYLPAAWISSGFGYDFHVDSNGKGDDGGSICSTPDYQGSGHLKQRLSAIPHSGRRIRLVGQCRTENVSESAGLFLRTKRLNGRPLTSDDMRDLPLVGTIDWRQCEMVVDVPREATTIAIGADLKGEGQIWFKNLTIEEAPLTTPTTDQYAMGCVGLWDMEPVNLDFAQDEFLADRETLANISQERMPFLSAPCSWERARCTSVVFSSKLLVRHDRRRGSVRAHLQCREAEALSRHRPWWAGGGAERRLAGNQDPRVRKDPHRFRSTRSFEMECYPALLWDL